MITDYIDLAVVAIWLFWMFFFGLVYYLQREGMREGYPLETHEPGTYKEHGFIWMPEPKTFLMPHGGTRTSPPANGADTRPVNGVPVDGFDGSPIEPNGGNLMLSGVGPAAWAEREDVPDRGLHGELKIAPMRALPGFEIVKGDIDPRGLPVVGADGVEGGTVKDVWIDAGESLIRYLEIETPGGVVIAPFTLADVNPITMNGFNPFGIFGDTKGDAFVEINCVNGAQIAEAPKTASPDQITMLEEEKVSAYFGSGYLYANADSREPLF
ncbi:MAG: photosynthetic reaction center subunit H [Pseudomonadota bacterium]